MKYKFFEHTADLGFEAYGKNLSELFKNCALAIFETTANLKKIENKEWREIKLKEDSIEHLLYGFLSDILYLRDVDLIIFKDLKVKVNEGKKPSINAKLFGEHIIPSKHELRRDIKAITMHQFEVKKEKGKWISRIIIDI